MKVTDSYSQTSGRHPEGSAGGATTASMYHTARRAVSTAARMRAWPFMAARLA